MFTNFLLFKAENWGIYTMLTEMPTFLSEIMGFKIDKVKLVISLLGFVLC